MLNSEKVGESEGDIAIFIEKDYHAYPAKLPSFFGRFFAGLGGLLGGLLIGALLCITAWPLVR